MPFSCYCNNRKFWSTVNTTLTAVTVAGERPSVLLVLCPSWWVCAQPSLLSVYQGNWLDCGEGGTDSPILRLFPALQTWFGVLEPAPSLVLAEKPHIPVIIIIYHLDWWRRQLQPTSTSEDLLLVITFSLEYWKPK